METNQLCIACQTNLKSPEQGNFCSHSCKTLWLIVDSQYLTLTDEQIKVLALKRLNLTK